MGFLVKSCALLAVLLCAGIVALVLAMVEQEPLLADAGPMSVNDLREARGFLAISDPRRLADGDSSAVTLREYDVELLLDYLLSQREGGKSRVELREGVADIALSAKLPDNPLGPYLNLQVELGQWADQLVLQQLRIGGVTVPGGLADALMRQVHRQLVRRVPEYEAALQAVNGYAISNGQLSVNYQWQPALLEQISSRGSELLVSEEQRERLMAHAGNLAATAADPALPRVISLSAFIGPMFRFAQQRGGDPVEENRAAILAMAMYILGIDVPRMLGAADAALPQSERHLLRLSGRHDFAQHFLIAAGLTVSTGTDIADSIGLLKEFDDTNEGGSGFSFTDIGAHRTGIRFGELATASPASARVMQEQLAAPAADETLFMAEFRDLPEALSDAEFKQRFGSADHPAYKKIMADIEQRIDNMPLFAAPD